MINKEYLNIIKKNNKYRIVMKQTYFLFFKRWVEITWKGDDNKDEPIEFENWKDAVGFVNSVTL
jgi:hypothetical protein